MYLSIVRIQCREGCENIQLIHIRLYSRVILGIDPSLPVIFQRFDLTGKSAELAVAQSIINIAFSCRCRSFP